MHANRGVWQPRPARAHRRPKITSRIAQSSIDLDVCEAAAERRQRCLRPDIATGSQTASAAALMASAAMPASIRSTTSNLPRLASGMLGHFRRQQCDVHDTDRRNVDGAKRSDHLPQPPYASFIAVAPETGLRPRRGEKSVCLSRSRRQRWQSLRRSESTRRLYLPCAAPRTTTQGCGKSASLSRL